MRQLRNAGRWAVPVVLVAAVASVGAVGPLSAAAEPALPALSAADLLVKAQQARVGSLSGQVRSTASLGLPALPTTSTADWASLAAGTHTLRVYADGPQRQRVDLLGSLAQASVVRSGRDLWTWSSSTRRVTRTALPDPAARPDGPGGVGEATDDPGRTPMTPQEVADRTLAAVTPTTRVSVGRAASVAGRDAYLLELRPQEPASLVGTVKMYVDATTGLTLRAVVTPRGSSEPAVDVGFTSLTLTPPPARTFAFRPPVGSEVEELPPPAGRARPVGVGPQALGAGWTAVVVTAAPDDVDDPSPSDETADDLPTLIGALRGAGEPVTGRFGTGRLLSTRLLTVLQTDDGRIFAGVVTRAELLRQADLAGAVR